MAETAPRDSRRDRGGRRALPDQFVHGQPEDSRQGRDREEGRRRRTAGLDLAEGLGGDTGAGGDLRHAAATARHAQQPAEPFAAFTLFGGRGVRTMPVADI